ncbi:transglycosylase family protein [Streptomyces marokkonensis]|uniref:Transglycosylase family protein n=1 Tax=Streptomyces marokkonensis TaxID=324855 RepID=A0ABW6QDH6_9ACTN
MLSGNGRHRRPRQAPALLVAAGVTGSAIAIPLLGAGGASAAEGMNWDRVAECESGGSWSQNSGNGYYGGLQLTQEDWEKYGGLDFASSADQASRGQQIAVAEKILADQGVGAWRTCGLLAGGLDQDAPSADAGTGVTDDSASDGTDSPDSPDSHDASAPSPSSSPSASPSATADDGKTPDASADESGNSDKSADSGAGSDRDGDADSGASSSPSSGPEGGESDKSGQSGDSSAAGAEGTGRHRGASAEEGKEQDRASDSSGRHASRGLNAWGGTVADSSTGRDGGDLSSDADPLAADDGWRALHVVNEQLIGGGAGLV